MYAIRSYYDAEIKDKFEAFDNKQIDWLPNLSALEPYSAKASAQTLITSIEKVIHNK